MTESNDYPAANHPIPPTTSSFVAYTAPRGPSEETHAPPDVVPFPLIQNKIKTPSKPPHPAASAAASVPFVCAPRPFARQASATSAMSLPSRPDAPAVNEVADSVHGGANGPAPNTEQMDREIEASAIEQIPILPLEEVTKLRAAAKARKRNRIAYFNGEGARLRLVVKNHEHVHASVQKYCALCGQNRNSSFRGHRSIIKCGYCDVHLCIKTHKGFCRSCWDTWHTVKTIKPCAPVGYDRRHGKKGDDVESVRNKRTPRTSGDGQLVVTEEAASQAKRPRTSTRRRNPKEGHV